MLTPTQIICANAGDSRACLKVGDEVIPLSFDHKPPHEKEEARIRRYGMVVCDGRVDGILAVARAFGDHIFKQHSILGAENQAVTANPDFVVRDRTDQDEFLVIACDGIWDTKTNEECVKYLDEKIKAQNGLNEWHDLTDPIETMLEEITADAWRYPTNGGTTDNCSCCVIYFNKTMGYTKTAVKPESPQRKRDEPSWMLGSDERIAEEEA